MFLCVYMLLDCVPCVSRLCTDTEVLRASFEDAFCAKEAGDGVCFDSELVHQNKIKRGRGYC